jgi:hypothetical protein
VRQKKVNWEKDVKYDVVQFNLNNPTGSDIEIDLFDSDSLEQIQTEPTPFDPVGGASQITISGTSPVLAAMAYMPLQNYLFTMDISGAGKRVIWDLTNNVQVAEYGVATGDGAIGQAIQRLVDGNIWSGNIGVAQLIESNWSAMNQSFHNVTDVVSKAGVIYDEATDTIFFGYDGTASIGSFNMGTSTLTDIATSGTKGEFITIDTVRRRLYATETASTTIVEIDIDTLTVVREVNFAASGFSGLLNLAVDPTSGKLFGSGTDFATDFVGVFDMDTASFNQIISASLPQFLQMRWVISDGKLYIYDDVNVPNEVTIINTSDNSVITYLGQVAGNVHTETAAIVAVPNDAVYLTKGAIGSPLGTLTVLPITQNFYIGGSSDYNFFVQSIFTAPKRIFAIEFNNLTIIQMANEWKVIDKDANGQECSVPFLPNNYTTNFQFDGTEALVDFEDGWILDITSKARYLVPANSTVILLIWYKEIKRSEALIGEKDFKKDGIAEPAFTAEEYNQQEQTGIEILEGSGRNVANYWIPSNMMVDKMVDKGFYPEGWEDMESFVPEGMVIDNKLKLTNK